MPFDWDKNDVCLTDDEGGLVAVFPQRKGDTVVWFMLNGRQRMATIRRLHADSDDYFAFEDDRGRHRWLQPVTVDGYNAVREKVGDTQPKYQDVEKLRSDARAAARLQPRAPWA